MSAAQPVTQIATVQLGELTCWHVRHAGSELLISQQGAQILRYQRDGQPPLIWLSEDAAYVCGQSVRGGVPLCWPWFGDLQRNPSAVQAMVQGPAPFHGLARTLDWQLDHSRSTEAGLYLQFSLPERSALPGWPHKVALSLSIALGDDLQIELHNHNRGSQPVAISQALHSYFAVSDSRQVRVQGLHGCRYIETLDNWNECRQQGELLIEGETDRIYLDLPTRLTLHDAGWQRALHLDVEGSRSAIVWNPWIDKAQRLSHFAADAWQRMLCIETANVWDDCLQLAPGAEHRLRLRLSTTPLL